jgi:hypothetical protein
MRLTVSAVIIGSARPAGRHRRAPPGTPIVPAAAAALCLPFMNAPSLTGYPATPDQATMLVSFPASHRTLSSVSSAQRHRPALRVLILHDGELRVFVGASGGPLVASPGPRGRRCGRPAARAGVCSA